MTSACVTLQELYTVMDDYFSIFGHTQKGILVQMKNLNKLIKFSFSRYVHIFMYINFFRIFIMFTFNLIKLLIFFNYYD